MEQLTPEEMDVYAETAMNKLERLNLTNELSLADVAVWWKEWFMKCGHKRLGRILLKFVPEE